MKDLSEYTTEELKEEIRRRTVIKMREVAAKNRIASWYEWEGIVAKVIPRKNHRTPLYYIDSEELKSKHEFIHLNKSWFFSLNLGYFRSKDQYPKLGERVKLRFRRTKECYDNYQNSLIVECESYRPNLHYIVDIYSKGYRFRGTEKQCLKYLKDHINEENLKIASEEVFEKCFKPK